jgi:hypothetical protein
VGLSSAGFDEGAVVVTGAGAAAAATVGCEKSARCCGFFRKHELPYLQGGLLVMAIAHRSGAETASEEHRQNGKRAEVSGAQRGRHLSNLAPALSAAPSLSLSLSLCRTPTERAKENRCLVQRSRGSYSSLGTAGSRAVEREREAHASSKDIQRKRNGGHCALAVDGRLGFRSDCDVA